jgi:preprotein translocase subunit SecE
VLGYPKVSTVDRQDLLAHAILMTLMLLAMTLFLVVLDYSLQYNVPLDAPTISFSYGPAP